MSTQTFSDSDEEIEKEKQHRVRGPAKPIIHIPTPGPQFRNWIALGKEQLIKRGRFNSKLRYKVFQSVVENAVYQIYEIYDIKCRVPEFTLDIDDILNNLIVRHSQTLSQWKGATGSRVKNKPIQWQGAKDGYFKLCKNWSDQHVWEFDDALWIPMFDGVLVYIDLIKPYHDYDDNQNLRHYLLYAILYALFASEIGLRCTKTNPLLLNATLMKSIKIKMKLKAFNIDVSYFHMTVTEECEKNSNGNKIKSKDIQNGLRQQCLNYCLSQINNLKVNMNLFKVVISFDKQGEVRKVSKNVDDLNSNKNLNMIQISSVDGSDNQLAISNPTSSCNTSPVTSTSSSSASSSNGISISNESHANVRPSGYLQHLVYQNNLLKDQFSILKEILVNVQKTGQIPTENMTMLDMNNNNNNNNNNNDININGGMNEAFYLDNEQNLDAYDDLLPGLPDNNFGDIPRTGSNDSGDTIIYEEHNNNNNNNMNNLHFSNNAAMQRMDYTTNNNMITNNDNMNNYNNNNMSNNINMDMYGMNINTMNHRGDHYQYPPSMNMNHANEHIHINNFVNDNAIYNNNQTMQRFAVSPPTFPTNMDMMSFNPLHPYNAQRGITRRCTQSRYSPLTGQQHYSSRMPADRSRYQDNVVINTRQIARR